MTPIYVRITIDGKRSEWSVQRNCEPGIRWNQTIGRVTGTKEEVKILNGYLDAIKANIFSVQREGALRNESVTTEKVKAKILHKTVEKQHKLIEVYKDHNAQFQKLVNLEYSIGTFKKFKSALKSLENFILWKSDKNDVLLLEVNYKFITDYEFYLKSEQNCSITLQWVI
ncbi:MAG: phage integrase SAM-like domain-containing protein [Chitinophagaceae bacterium]